MPGGFHPFHAGHADLYQQTKKAFPGADVYVAATNDQSERPFPFSIKEKLAKVAGVEPGHFIQVKSPFQAKEITQNYNPEQDVLIFVRSEKDKTVPPLAGGTKKDGSPAYFQPWTGKNLQPFGKHAYLVYLNTVKFSGGLTSASQIRAKWPMLDITEKSNMVMSLYPAAHRNKKLQNNIIRMLDLAMNSQQVVAKPSAVSLKPGGITESNVFTNARMNAIKAGKKTFNVHNKIYTVTGDIKDELEANTSKIDNITECLYKIKPLIANATSEQKLKLLNLMVEAKNLNSKSTTVISSSMSDSVDYMQEK